MDFRLPGGHLGMDERASPTAQPGKDWASCPPCHSNSTARFHHPVRLINNYPIKFGQKSWCNLPWPADFQRPHCKNCSILQVCSAQHQNDQALPNGACCTTSCPGRCHFSTGLLQCYSGWTSIIHNQTFTNDSGYSCTTGLQWNQKGPCHTSLYLPALAPSSSSRNWCLHIEQAQHPPTSTHFWESTSPPEVWDQRVSDVLWYQHRAAQNHFPELFHSPFLAGGMNFSPLSGMLNPWQFSSDTWKLISFVTIWQKKQLSLSLISPCLACTNVNNAWNFVLQALPGFICLFDESLIVFLNCKSLWIKVSVKWITVNVNSKTINMLAW